MNPTVSEIVKQYLEDNGYDGLYDPDNDDEGCGCLNNDLFIGGVDCGLKCRAGYNVTIPDYAKECGYWISSEKPEVKA
jgi:hypothetical protein